MIMIVYQRVVRVRIEDVGLLMLFTDSQKEGTAQCLVADRVGPPQVFDYPTIRMLQEYLMRWRTLPLIILSTGTKPWMFLQTRSWIICWPEKYLRS